MKPKRLMIQMTLNELIEFYERCARQEANTEQERVNILVDMSLEGFPVAISETSRTNEEVIKDMARHYGKIMTFNPLENTDESY